jgi:nucleoside-diphosphate-sugar epimerase/glycosyltransferase involved in cell wall biosynthesis
MNNPSIFDNTLSEQDKEDILKLQGPILVVGASGFIGANLFFALAKIRDDVYASSRQAGRSWRLLQWVTSKTRKQLVTLDITSPEAVSECIETLKPQTVFNLSAYGAYERQNDGYRIHQVNYMGTFNLMQALFEKGCDAFVHAGTSSEYGVNCQAPSEDDVLRPNSDYAVSKGAISLLISYFGQVKGFACANLRLYSIYGPWEERDRLIPRVSASGMDGSYPPFADKRISRDFVFVDDCIRAMVKAALTVCKKEPGMSINIATGKKNTLEDVALAAKEIFNISAAPTFGSMPNRRWDLSDWYGTTSRAKEKMGWEARTTFIEGLRLCGQWEQSARSVITFGAVPKTTKKLSAIIACYRDHQAIPVMYDRLTRMFQSQEVDYEIIFVNDNSPTEDEAVIRALCEKDPHVIGVSHSRNFGSQSAFLSGMEISTGDAVVLLDGDLQDPPEVIPEFMTKWDEGYEIIYGVRVRRQAALHMQLFYKLFYRIFRSLSDIPIPVDAGDFSLIDRKVVDHLIQFPEKDVFLRGLRAWVGFKQTGVPYVRPERMFGITTNNLMKNIWWAKKAIFSFSVKPLEYIQRMGFILFVVSIVLSFGYLINYYWSPQTRARGVTTMVLLILGLGGVQLFSLSILGDYLGKILEEVKNRPRFIRSRIFTAQEVIESRDGLEKFVRQAKEISHGKYR